MTRLPATGPRQRASLTPLLFIPHHAEPHDHRQVPAVPPLLRSLPLHLHLHDKVALVLGAGGGLGGAIAEALADEGTKVALADINKEALGAAQERLSARTATAAVQWDLGDLDAIPDHLAAITEELGPVDILVNVTGG